MFSLDLCSGIAGIGLAAHWAGIETAAFCEIEPFCQKVLKKNFPRVPVYDNIFTLSKARLEKDEVIGPGKTIRSIFVGDPCQPYSYAGDREGEEDDRYLWPEVNRLLSEIRPNWIVRENVAGSITLGLDQVLTDLDDLGYTTQSFNIPACAIGADHERERVFVVGHSYCGTKSQEDSLFDAFRKKRDAWETVARKFRRETSGFNRPIHQPAVCRVDDGVPTGIYKSRMKALGNAVNPYQIYPILAAIKQIDDLINT